MLFEGHRTASFSMMAFTEKGERRTTLFGTRGEITCNGTQIRLYDFLTDSTRVWHVTIIRRAGYPCPYTGTCLP